MIDLNLLIDQIEEKASIYNIHRCMAGWGIQFYEPPEGFEMTQNNNWRDHLVTHDYYPTLEECVKAEHTKLP